MRFEGRLRRGGAALAAVAALALALTGCTGGDPADENSPSRIEGELAADTVEQLQAAVDQAIDASGASGAIVGVWVPWAGSWVAGVGSTAHGSETPVETDMAFRAGQVTRSMTCDILYDLVAEEAVALDDTVAQWVPGSPDLKNVTLRQLCDNTSGLARSRDVLGGTQLKTPERTWHPREVAATGLGRDRTEPGVALTDSDTGYLLLGLALQNATGKTATELFREHIAAPLELTWTGLPGSRAAAPGDPALPGYRSTQADRDAGCVAPTEYTELSASFGFTDSGAVTTISDLGVYMQSVAAQAREGDGLSARWSAAKPLSAKTDSWNQYAGGTRIAGSMIGQAGRVPGYLTSAYSDMDNGLTVAVTLNNSAASSGLVDLLAKELAAIASKAPASEGQTAPEFGLPWTAEDYHQRIAEAAVCPLG